VYLNTALAHFSNDLLLGALVIYSLALLAFAGDFAYGREHRASLASASKQAAVPELAAVGAGGGVTGGGDRGASAPEPPQAAAGTAASATGVFGAGGVSAWVRAAVALTAAGLAAHLAAVLTRGLAVHRVPWGDMYEFITALTCVAVAFFLTVMIRYRAWSLGVFVMGSVVVILGITETVIYTPAGPLAPALQSYWLAIHVTAMTLSTGIFFVAAVMGVVYLFAERNARKITSGSAAQNGAAQNGAAQNGAAQNGIMRRLPSPEAIDRLTYRTVVFGFPIWTFGIIAGGIWADQAWGRYWGWDPVETWAFITWVVYACFLHARATAGWRGRRAAYIQLLGFACLVFNVLVVQTFVTGLHSYAGLN
jgi:cytochrome c-type biogenesis protein CcsB